MSITEIQEIETQQLPLYINGKWRPSESSAYLDVMNPASGDSIARVPSGHAGDVDAAVRAASDAFPGWRRTPPEGRIQYLFKLKQLLEEHFEQIARTIT